MNRNQYVTKQRWFCEQSAKSYGEEYKGLRQQYLVDPSTGDNQAQGSILSDPTESPTPDPGEETSNMCRQSTCQ